MLYFFLIRSNLLPIGLIVINRKITLDIAYTAIKEADKLTTVTYRVQIGRAHV